MPASRGLHRHDDERQAEHDVRDQDRPEAELPREAGADEQREQRGAHHDLGRRHRQEDHQVGRRPAAEAVPDQREGHQGAEDGRTDASPAGRSGCSRPSDSHIAGSSHGFCQLSQREPVELVDQPAVGVVEGHQHDDEDRDEHVERAPAARGSGPGARASHAHAVRAAPPSRPGGRRRAPWRRSAASGSPTAPRPPGSCRRR